MGLSHVFLLFIIYSVIGWVSEVIYCSVFFEHKFVNRGFLQGPLCPVYGFGALLVLFLLQPFNANLFYLFIMAVIVTTTLEYITSWALEKIFSTKWWDYSDMRFNIHGRVCLLNSVLFGLMSVLAVRFVHPVVLSALGFIPSASRDAIAGILASVFLVDVAFTLRTLVDFREKLSALAEFMESVKESIDVREWFNEHDLQGSLERIRARAVLDASGVSQKLLERFEKIVSRSSGMTRLLKAFPALRRGTAHSYAEFHAPDIRTKRGLYVYFWNFFAASFIGSVLETVWALLTTGTLQLRSGLVYGTLNPLYGIGVVIMIAVLSRLEKKRDFSLLVGGMMIGSAFEYFCSLAQELSFGTVSWDYAGTQLNIHGRTNLMSAFIWGVLGLLWVRDAYPILMSLIGKIRRRAGKIAAIVLAVAVVANCAVSAFAVHRWSARHHGQPAESSLDRLFDEHFADERLERTFPNMKFVE